MFAGYEVPTKYYQTLAKSLAAQAFIVIQVSRTLALSG